MFPSSKYQLTTLLHIFNRVLQRADEEEKTCSQLDVEREYEDKNKLVRKVLSRVYTSGFCMRLPNCVAIFYYLPYLSKAKVRNRKTKDNAKNA